MSEKRRSRRSEHKWGQLRIVNSVLLIFLCITAIWATYTILANNILAFRYVNVLLIALFVLLVLLSAWLIVKNQAKKTTLFLLLVGLLTSSGVLFASQQLLNLTSNVNGHSNYTEFEMAVYVKKDSDIKDVSQLSSVQAPMKVDKNNIETMMSALKNDKKVDVKVDDVASYQEAYDNLKSGKSKAMVLSGSYASLLESVDSNYASNLKTIYTYKIKTKNNTSAKQADSKVFNIYISGIDTYGSISTVSRSDVNIIMTVNMNTHKILLTTTPRDAYVKIPGGGANQYDKLTHAGIYGVETSEQTLENLYGINIDYYARINFTSFLKLIDQLGGVTVHNDQAFTSLHGKFDFPVGDIKMNSEQALGFVRERYSLDGGDNDRGKNQEKVISAIVNKLASLHSVSNFNSIVNNLQDSVQTNMSLDTINSLANTQLDSGSKFTVTSQAVTGTGSTGQLTSYAMPNSSLYMMKLDDSSVASASQAIKNMMEEQ